MNTTLAAQPLCEQTHRFLDRAGKLWINGQWKAARLRQDVRGLSIRPRARSIAHCAAGDKADIDAAVHAARRAFESGPWSRMTPSERGRLIWKLGDLLEEHGDEFAELETLDNGKPLAVARAADVPLAVDLFRYMAGWATKIHGQTFPISVPYMPGSEFFSYTAPRADRRRRADHPLELPAVDGRLETRPGPGGGLHRRAQAGRADAAERPAAGRTDRGGRLPRGRGQHRHRPRRNGRRGAGRPSGRRQDRLHRLDGSRPPDRRRPPAKSNLKKVTLELGGKSPNIVLRRRRPEHRHPRRRQRHLLQPRPVLLRRLAALRAASRSTTRSSKASPTRPGRSAWAAASIPPRRWGRWCRRSSWSGSAATSTPASATGPELVTGGKRVGERGYFVEPTVFAGTRQSMKIVREEIFGPVVAAMPFDDSGRSRCRWPTTRTYGLAAAVWTRDISKAHRLARRLKAGTVWINCYNVFDAALPFGGYKESGWGREMGQAAVELYTEVKAVTTKLA